VTLKMRLGWDETSINAPELGAAGLRCGCPDDYRARTHALPVLQRARPIGRAIAAVKQAVDVPVVANGDVVSIADARRILQESGCDAVMAGRGAYGRPWLPGYLASADPECLFVATCQRLLI
jgi:tRNA-dihydrouridine synthase B